MPKKTAPRKSADSEYRLLVVPQLAERTQRMTTLLVLETVKSFATFRYELSVQEHFQPPSFRFVVAGFKTPRLDLPSSGPAQYRTVFEGLDGVYEVTIEGIDGRINTFSLRVAPTKVSVLKAPQKPFVHIVTDTDVWNSLST
jgi:hypothetical protein